MKIYCLLVDSLPEHPRLTKYLQSKGFKVIPQVTNCFTTTSVVSLLTGKLPSDLEEGGIGYETHYKNKTNSKIDYKWKDQLLIKKLYDKGYYIDLVNCEWFYPTICDEDYIYKLSACPVSIEKAHDFRGTEKYKQLSLITPLPGNIFYENYKQYIFDIQQDNVNSFHLIKHNQYHDAIIFKLNKEEAVNRIIWQLDQWDFNEPDSFFYIFSDHHDFTKIDKLCQPPSCITWAAIKDNRRVAIEIPDCIHISDFRHLLRNIQTYDKNKVFFSEDARLAVDPQNSTTAIAIQIKGDKAYQTTYKGDLNGYKKI
jgi:hypothetical protein